MDVSLSEDSKKENISMKPNMTFPEKFKKLQKMKEEMDRLWKNLFIESAHLREEEIWQWCERFPKFEGAGRKSSDPTLN